MIRIIAAAFCCVICGTSAARSVECPGNSHALGTSRVIVVDPIEHARLGTMQYAETLPLADKEIVLTFDDGPLPPNTNYVLDILASECVKATFFIVGEMARAHPDLLRRVYAQGHTIGTHSQNHPKTFKMLSIRGAQSEIEDGIASTAAALGDLKAVAPFFPIRTGAHTASRELPRRSRLMLWVLIFSPTTGTHDQNLAKEKHSVSQKAKAQIESKVRCILRILPTH
jgi:hypothetical protein